mgnify:CR=1 FL=1
MLESAQQGLYRPEFEHDACGIGFRANMKGRKSHQMVADAITMLERMDHRGACGTQEHRISHVEPGSVEEETGNGWLDVFDP